MVWQNNFPRTQRVRVVRVAFSASGNFNYRRGNLPLPPLSEQKVLIKNVERRLSDADALESKLHRQLGQSRDTRTLLLRDAFRGRLHPQDPRDEPASVMLGRMHISSERPKSSDVTSSTNKRRNTMNKLTLTPETMAAAWERLGQRSDANRLFSELKCSPDQVTAFYETLRNTPSVRQAFDRGIEVPEPSESQQPTTLATRSQISRFRLLDLWLEEFKNLKDYTIKFDLAYGLDVVLGWNGTGKSNLFECLVVIFRDLHEWKERNRWPDQPMNAYRLRYEINNQFIEISWIPQEGKRPVITAQAATEETATPIQLNKSDLPLPRFIFGYYSGPTNRLAEHFQPMNQAHYIRLREATSDDPATLASLLEQRRFFCAETHHAKYVLLAFCYKEDPDINNFLRDRLRIVGFESALFVIRKPRWAKGGSPQDFWGAKGVMRRVLERLRRFAVAPMVVEQTVSDGYRSTKEDHYYFFLPDLARLHAFAKEYDNARTFFLALESTDFSELIHDVKIQVRVNATSTQEIAITFRELSEGEQQLLMVLGLMRFTKSIQSLVLLDEPDTHLNPHWSIDYLKLLTKVMSVGPATSDEEQTSQILISTHDPLVISSLMKEQVHLLKRDSRTGICVWVPASINPRGLGFAGILTSEMFGFRSDLDEETL
jgi:hypothetical protein